MFKASVVQLNSQDDVKNNLKIVTELIIEAAAAGSQFVLLPENFAFMGSTDDKKLSIAEKQGAGLIQETVASLAQKHNIWVLAGTIPIKCESKDEIADHPDSKNKIYAASMLYDDNGAMVCRYDKIHLFDVSINVKNKQESYCESNTILAGHNPKVYKTPFGTIGFSICYDVRFPELYRAYCAAGVDIITVPSAFVYETGKAHWHVLNRARAIENQVFVLAANQSGEHPSEVGKRKTYGHSIIVNPWGEIIAEQQLDGRAGLITASIDLASMNKLRVTFPVTKHRKL